MSLLRLALAAGLLIPALAPAAPGLVYPDTRKGDVVDVLHGVKVPDPYRWLENDVREDEEVEAWVKAQQVITTRYLANLPKRAEIETRLTALWEYQKVSTPTHRGGRYFQSRNDGLQNQAVLWVSDAPDAEGRVLIDPNTWSEDGTKALGGTAASDDGRYLAYGVADGGSDWRTWHVMEIETGKVLADELKWVKFSGVSWTPDSRGFFYSRYPAPQEGAEYQSLNKNQKVYYHRVGTSQDQDALVYARPDHPDWGFSADVTDDGRYLVITVWKGTDRRYRVAYRDLADPYAMPVDLITSFDNEYSLVGNNGPVFYFQTDLAAPRRRVVAIDVRKPAKEHWREVVPQNVDTLQSTSLVGNMLVARYLRDARTAVVLYAESGEKVREVELPGIGSAWGFDGRRQDSETFFMFSSFATPPTIYRYHLITGKADLLHRSKVDMDPEEFEVKQVFFSSKDGTRVPMFLAHKKGLELDATNPTLLYGYGGFNSAMTPYFSVSRLAWMEMGGVFALANIRGGGEYGVDWHKAGTKLRKQNTFDDFIAAAEWLVSNKYTTHQRLGIQGGSNGGLLVGAVMTQRPELFGACLPAVGVMDMLRYHQFTAGRFWVDDYGSADDAEEFKVLHSYSPYHNLKDGVTYPPTLVTTADHDDRVVPSHSFKFAARLQAAHEGGNPVLIRIESRAGHGAGTPTSKRIAKVADQWAFLAHHLGIH